ncbi:mannose-binding protein [Streptomyces bluensis]|uniref:Mannose-binding protein n=1 Tax=Streptomyces bluensis TaxID=33897 RepID=A0ABW6USC8_9ACTN
MAAQRNTGQDTTPEPARGTAQAQEVSAVLSPSGPQAEAERARGRKAPEAGESGKGAKGGAKEAAKEGAEEAAKEGAEERADTADAPIHGLGRKSGGTGGPVTVSGATVGGPTARLTSALARAKAEAKAEAEAEKKTTATSAARAEKSGGTTPLAVAVGQDGLPPEGEDPTAAHRGRPKKPMLAAAAMAGAVLLSVPLLLMAGGNDKDDQRGRTQGVALGADTTLGADEPHMAPGDYATGKPTASPSASPSKTPATKPKAAGTPSAESSREPESRKSTPDRVEPAGSKTVVEKSKSSKWTTKTVSAGSQLVSGQSWWTNRIRMTMQGDGNLVVYNEDNDPIWAAGVFGENHKVRFQKDGNLVVYTADDRPVWASQTNGHEGAKLVLRTDGKVAVVDGNTTIWST